MNKVLEIEGLRRTYRIDGARTLDVLKSIDITVEAGEIVGLIGPSGSGKSSLLHAAGLLEAAQADKLEIEGQSFLGANDKDRTQARLLKIGFVYQFHHLLPEFTAMGNVALPLQIQGKATALAEERARELLSRLGLTQRLDHRPAQLSGGEQQRVAIARALAHRPKLLLADEPTGNLDPQTSSQVFDSMRHLVYEEKAGALIATHNLELASMMDRVLRLKDGRLVSA